MHTMLLFEPSIYNMTTQTIEIPFIDCKPPRWASGLGQDAFGYYAEFSVFTGSQYWKHVTQRMRWIPPGTFLMGAALGEPTDFGPETQHEVTLTQGFWLADSACSQSLWFAITKKNPSKFQGDQLPVEGVSFEDVQSFLGDLNKLVPDASFALPTEAQWEYACRAGTQTPFSFGNTITTDQVNYDGNYRYGKSKKGECRQKTVDVKALPANAWGLYQMHGNVWEWCADWYADYSPEPQVDPTGPDTGSGGSGRVLRGGSWVSLAANVRSAYRVAYDPGVRFVRLGFRLLSSARSSQSGAEQVSGSRASPRDEAAENQRTQ